MSSKFLIGLVFLFAAHSVFANEGTNRRIDFANVSIYCSGVDPQPSLRILSEGQTSAIELNAVQRVETTRHPTETKVTFSANGYEVAVKPRRCGSYKIRSLKVGYVANCNGITLTVGNNNPITYSDCSAKVIQ